MTDDHYEMQAPVCPIPINPKERILLGHGSGGKLQQALLEEIFYPHFRNSLLAGGSDGAVIQPEDGKRIVVSTDTHVVKPLFFPGGDIGKLAICGTVNDVSMMGAQPKYLTVGFILEEGLELSTLHTIIDSMSYYAELAGVEIIAGDTKVVERGFADGLYINTTGVGFVDDHIDIDISKARFGSVIILSGSIGDHGIAVLQARGELGFESTIKSDIAPLNRLVEDILSVDPTVQVLKDPTRGGLATSLNEIAVKSQVGIEVFEENILVNPPVSSTCEMLGFDPLYIANEGKLIAVVSEERVEQVLDKMRNNQYGKRSRIIGKIIKDPPKRVLLRTRYGPTRILDSLAGEMLPRIC